MQPEAGELVHLHGYWALDIWELDAAAAPLADLILLSLYHFLATCQCWKTWICLVGLGKTGKASSGIFIFDERRQALFQRHKLCKHRTKFQTMICLPLGKNKIDVHCTSQEDTESRTVETRVWVAAVFWIGGYRQKSSNILIQLTLWKCNLFYKLLKTKGEDSLQWHKSKTRGALTDCNIYQPYMIALGIWRTKWRF